MLRVRHEAISHGFHELLVRNRGVRVSEHVACCWSPYKQLFCLLSFLPDTSQRAGEDVRGKRKMMVPHCGHYWHTTHRLRTSVRASDRQTGQKIKSQTKIKNASVNHLNSRKNGELVFFIFLKKSVFFFSFHFLKKDLSPVPNRSGSDS